MLVVHAASKGADHAHIQMLIRGLFGVHEGHLEGPNQRDPSRKQEILCNVSHSSYLAL